MNHARSVLGAVGLVLVAGTLVAGGAFGVLPVEDAVTALGNDYFFLALFAALAAALAVVALARGTEAALNEADPPDPEYPLELPVAGAEFDDAIRSRVDCLPVVGTTDRNAVRERLRRAAVETLMTERGHSRPDATRAVASGEWTTDRHAAAFLGGDARPHAGPSLWLAAWSRGRPWFQVGARRTAVAVADHAGIQEGMAE